MSGPHVIIAGFHLCKGLFANLASIRPRPCVDIDMLNHVGTILGAVNAAVALKVVVIQMERQMSPQSLHYGVLLAAAGELARKDGLLLARGA